MNYTKDLFGSESKYIYLTNAPESLFDQAVSGENLRDMICITDENLYPDDLLMVDGSVIEDTGLFVSASFTTIDEDTDYCFQCGSNSKGEILSTLVKIVNLGRVEPFQSLFHRNNQLITPSNELLEAHYLATYKDGKWFILDKEDREGKLDCESQAVLSRAKEYVF